MKIAIASGKGGTGKTTVAVNLAYVASHNGQQVAYVDCDVEEPNGHLFLNPAIDVRRPVGKLIPKVNEHRCSFCGQCNQICRFNAIVCMNRKVLVFPDLCHACGGCELVCPARAITEVSHEVGQLETGAAGSIHFIQGCLNIGEISSVPVIKAVKEQIPKVDMIFVDSPPGTSCPVVESVRQCDYVILVTEPTPFGLNDLILAVDMVRALELPFGVVINRADAGDQEVMRYCQENSIPILALIPHDRKIAEAYSRGELLCEALPDYAPVFTALLKEIG